MRKNIFFSIPTNFEADELLSTYKFRADKKNNLKDAMHFILHSLIQMEFRKDLQDDYERRGFYPLSSEILEKICGNRYKTALVLLENHGVIENDKNAKYSENRFSKGYRLIGDSSCGELSKTELLNGGVKARLGRQINEQDKINSRNLQKIEHITKWLDNTKLNIDLGTAHYFLEYYLQRMLDGIPVKLPKNLTKKEVINKIHQRYNSANLVVKDIHNGNFSPTRTGRDHRLHSRLTSLKSELRNLMSYNGQQLVSLDITASQPYLFTQLLNPGFYSKNPSGLSIPDLYPELHKIIIKGHDNKTIRPSITMSPTYAERQYPTALQPKTFASIDWKGDFYTYLMDCEMEMFGSSNRVFSNRRTTKKIVMLLLYNKSNQKYKARSFERFEQLFPTEASIIRFFDSLPGDNFLPILLQRFESALMLEKVGKAIADQLPDAPLITVHDSFLTTSTYVKRVCKIMFDTLYHHTNTTPGIKIEPYDKARTVAEVEQTASDDLSTILSIRASRHSHKNQATVKRRNPLQNRVPEYDDDILLFTSSYMEISQKLKKEAKVRK